MNPATINSTTFTLTGPSGTAEVGQVTYNVANNTASFAPAAPLAPNTLYTAAISTRARDVFGIGLANRLVWTFTTGAGACSGVGAPAVVSATPANGACPNTIATAVFNEAMDPTTLDTSTFTLTGPGTTPVNGVVTYDAASNGVTFTPANALVPSTTYTATITTGAADLLGQPLASDFVWTFTTAATLCQPPLPPNSVNPANGSSGICSSTVVAATFPQAMNPATINPATFKLTGPGVTPVAGTITHDVPNQMFVFTPTSTLALNTAFTATITTGAQDVSGNALASNFVWTFTTSAAACVPPPPPTVISVSPPDAALGICPDVVVTATFDEAMNPATITTTTLKLAGPGVTPVTGAVALDVTGRIASFTPASDLALSTIYTGTVTTGAQDLIGNGLASDFVWSFTTATQICQPPVPLGSVANFDAVAGSTVTNTGPTTIAGGDIGLSPGSELRDFLPDPWSPRGDACHRSDRGAGPTRSDFRLQLRRGLARRCGPARRPERSDVHPWPVQELDTVMLSAGGTSRSTPRVTPMRFSSSRSRPRSPRWEVHRSFWPVEPKPKTSFGRSAVPRPWDKLHLQGDDHGPASHHLEHRSQPARPRALARNAAVTFDNNTVTAP